MKTGIKLTLLIMIGVATTVMAQRSPSSAFWVVEGNIHQPNYTMIRFYDAQCLLIKEEKLVGKFIDIRRKQNQKLLNKKLEELTNQQVQVVSNRRRMKAN